MLTKLIVTKSFRDCETIRGVCLRKFRATHLCQFFYNQGHSTQGQGYIPKINFVMKRLHYCYFETMNCIKSS